MRNSQFKRLMILDGYNVIHKIPELSGDSRRSLRERREALIRFMQKWQQANSFKGKICIVFDGRDGVFGGEGNSGYGMECLFTATKEEADDRIITILKQAKDVSGIIVVSDDNYVRNNCKAYSVDVKPVSYLLRASQSAKPGSGRRHREGEKRIDQATKNAINHELKKQWGIE